ncbi:MAG: DUF2589 domain-containing protein [Bacteroidales bacterium]|nr:DUF2589 domain-containing protein [Bacteroidales bacterium]
MADNNQDPNNAPNKFVGIPIEELVAAPLVAVCDSQKKLAQSAYEFMTEIGFNDEGKTRMVEFNLQRPIQGASQPQDIKVQVPFLGLVPLPNLLIDDVQVDFQTEVTTTETSEEKSASEGSTNANANFKFGCFGGGSVNVSGKVSSSRENTRSTNQTAKYQVYVSARQQRQTEGLSKLMDIMASCVEPLPGNKE